MKRTLIVFVLSTLIRYSIFFLPVWAFASHSLIQTIPSDSRAIKESGDGKLKQALDTANEALAMAKQAGDVKRIGEANLNLGVIYDRGLKFREAIPYYLRAMESFKKSNDKILLANACEYLGLDFQKLGNFTEALDYYNNGLVISEALDESGRIADFCGRIGTVYTTLGNYAEALNYLNRRLTLFNKSGDRKGLASTYLKIGVVHDKKGDYLTALDNFLIGMRLFEEIDDKKGIADIQYQLGITNTSLSNYSEAINYHRQAIAFFETTEDWYSLAVSQNQLGITFFRMGKYEESLRYHRLGLEFGEKIGDIKFTASCSENIGACYAKLHHFDEALQYHLKSLRLSKVTGEKYNIAKTYTNIGSDYQQLNRNREAIDTLHKALLLSSEIGAKDLMKTAYRNLTDCYYQMRNVDSTYEYFEKYTAMKDSLLSEEKVRQLAEMNVRYEAEKKDKAIVKLSYEKELHAEREARERVKTNWALAGGSGLLGLASVIFYQYSRRRETKNKLALNQLNNKVLRSQLNPHFIFNALNSIRNYIELHPGLVDQYLTKFSMLMRQVLENSEEEKITLQEEISMLENYMQLESLRLPHGFDYEVILDEGTDAANSMIPPLILQPMIENAIWHGLKPLNRRGKIILRFAEARGLLEVTIEDDGMGLGSATVATLSSQKKRSMGLQITRERIELLNRKAKSKGWLIQQLFEQGAQSKVAIPIT